MIIDGIWWLVIIFVVFVALFIIAKLKKPQEMKNVSKNLSKGVKEVTASTNLALQKLYQQLVKQLPDYTINMKKNHITIAKASKKLLMITLDNGKEVGTRKLGGVMVMNFHQAPTYKDVLKLLQSR